MGKSKSISHSARINHGIFTEVVQCRLGVIPLNWQDSREICTGKDFVGILCLEQAAEQHDIFVEDGGSYPRHVSLHLPPVGELTADGIPLVDDEEKLFACGIVNG